MTQSTLTKADAELGQINNMPDKTTTYERLRAQIIAMEISPGTDLDEKSLVQKFGVSRTPVREALIRLSADGLVELRKNRGATVTPLDFNTLRSIFEAGDFIERAYTRLACNRRTDEDISALGAMAGEFQQAMRESDVAAMVDSNTRFHQCIANASGNKYFAECYRRILADHERIAQLWYSDNFDHNQTRVNDKIVRQHQELIDAIESRDVVRAESVTMDHASLCKDGLQRLLSEGSDLLADLSI